MTRRTTGKRSGQAIIMVTLALIAMFGLIGLAVDLGWAHFVRKSARAAADAAALAAVKEAYAHLGAYPSYSCSDDMLCVQVQCPEALTIATNNLEHGCLYAKRNGFSDGAMGGRQSVSLNGGITSPFETGTGPVEVHYWATATVTQRIPQLFSAILGNTLATVSVTSSAAILDMEVPGSLILLDHQHDETHMGNGTQFGVNLLVQANDNQGMYALQTTAGIRMASQCGSATVGTNATTCSNGANQWYYAGENQGGGTVYSPDIRIRLDGWYQSGGSAEWLPENGGRNPSNGYTRGFDDPMAGKGQAPWNPLGVMLPDIPVPGGDLTSEFCRSLSGTAGLCIPGKYYAVQNGVATGRQLAVNGDITFTSGAEGFGAYVFYGGVAKGGSGAELTFQPGVYTFAGALPRNNAPGIVLDTATNFTMRDMTESTGANSDAGELFIFTDGDYGGRIPPPTTGWVAGLEEQLNFGTATFASGRDGTYINLHGLNPEDTLIESNQYLEPFGGALVWWDRDNSTVKHDASGNIDYITCGSGHDLDNPCTNTLEDPRSPELQLQASPSVNLYGVISQPRGSWTTMIGGGGYSGPIQLITGALNVQANSNVNLTVPEHTATITVVSLVQ